MEKQPKNSNDHSVFAAIKLAWEASPIPSFLVQVDNFKVSANEAGRQALLGEIDKPAAACLRMMGRRQFLLLRSAIHEASNGGSQVLRNVTLNSHGERHVVNLKVFPVESPPKLVAIFVVDRTEESETKFEYASLRSLVDQSEELLYISDEAGRLVFLNDATAKALGVPAEKAIGKYREQLMPMDEAIQHTLSDKAALEARAALKRTENLTIMGVPHIYESKKFSIDSGAKGRRLIGGISRDVTTERKFNESTRFSETLFHNARDAIALTSATGMAKRVNRSFEVMTGFSDASIKNRSMTILGIGNSAQNNMNIAMEAAQSSGFWNGQLELRNADGSKRIVWTRVSLMRDDDNQPESMMWIITDISELQTAQDLRLAAERESKEKNEFLAMMSHELRTPLGGILGSLELVLDDADAFPPRVLDRLHNIKSAGETLLQIVNDLLDMSRLQAGKVQLEANPFSLLTVMKRVCAINRVTATAKKVELSLIEGKSSKATFIGDRHRLAQILHNLIGNAIKFTPSEGTINVSVTGLDPLTITIEDSGIGMTKEETARIFQAFEQADKTISRRFGGTGLGLTIVTSLVDLMEGKIDIKSAKGKGTNVTVTLPLKLVSTSPVEDTDLVKVEEISKTLLQDVKVLVADDNFINRTILTSFLEGTGASVTVAEDGDMAVDCFAANPSEVLCLDISMPGRDGISALRAIREHCKEAKLPVPRSIAVTANAMPHQQLEYLAHGFDACLSKPFRREEVVRLVRELANQITEPQP